MHHNTNNNHMMNTNPHLVFDNDPFQQMDIFSFNDFEYPNVAIPKEEEINNLKPISGHLAMLHPSIAKNNQIESEVDLAIKCGLISPNQSNNINMMMQSMIQNNMNQNLQKFNNNKMMQTNVGVNNTTNNMATITTLPTAPKKVAKGKKVETKKAEPKKRGRKSSQAESKQDISEEETNTQLPQKYRYLEDKEKEGTLTEEEQKLLKKERRLIKNRESAQQFRKRQKMHTQELQDKVDNLTDENLHLKHEVESLHKDKQQLELQIKNLWQFVNKAFTFAVPYRIDQN